jgi:hypothetical protein
MDEKFDEKFRALAAERDALRIEVAEADARSPA